MADNLKVLIVDDEQRAIDYLQQLLVDNIPEVTVCEVALGSLQAITKIKEFEPDLILLDIEMPHMNGFELLNRLENWNFGIIYTTAFNKYAIQAIKFSAMDYLLKPIDPDELRQAILKFIATHRGTKHKNALYKNFLDNLSKKETHDFKLALPTKHGISFQALDMIVRIEADSNYSTFYFIETPSVIVAKTLKEYSEMLNNHGFIRIHKSHLINKEYISHYLPEGKVALKNKLVLEVSRRRRPDVKKKLGLH